MSAAAIAMLEAGMRPDASTVITEWMEPGLGASCAWRAGDLVAVQMETDASPVAWRLAPEHEAWARAAWAAVLDGSAQVEPEVVTHETGGRFGNWMGDDFDLAHLVRSDLDLLVIEGVPLAGVPLHRGSDAEALAAIDAIMTDAERAGDYE